MTAAGLVTSLAPPASAAPVDLKQNNSDAVTTGFRCSSNDTTVLRRYDLDGDHDITLPFTVSSATFGAWILGFPEPESRTPTAEVTISTIPAEDDTLAFADLTQLATVEVAFTSTLASQFLLDTADVEAVVADPVATDLVLAVTFDYDEEEGVGESGAGSNGAGETDPTYVAQCSASPSIVALSSLVPGFYVPMWVTGEEASDVDDDGVADATDNCVNTPNEDQVNNDDDALGDACDDDDDNDMALDGTDNCPIDANADQANLDGDDLGDVCDGDDDGDTVGDGDDNCPTESNLDQANHDEDPLGDACDDDDDNDTVLDEADACDILAGNPARPKAEGCPAVPRTLTAHYESGDIGGTVESSAPECTAQVPVVVSWRKNDGTMRRRSTTTDALGDFSVHTGPVKPDGAHHWFFWVRAPAVLVPDVGLCSFTTLRDPATRH